MVFRHYLRLHARTGEDMPTDLAKEYRKRTAATGRYRDIRANMEQTSMCTGLDHQGEGSLILAGEAIAVGVKGIDPGPTTCSRSPAEAADTFRDPAGSARISAGGAHHVIFVSAVHSG
jgi:hypothetical protein